jgi:hypothetical protein
MSQSRISNDATDVAQSDQGDTERQWQESRIDVLAPEDVDGLIRSLRDFLTPAAIESAAQKILDAGGANRFRLDLLNEKLPRIAPLQEFDKLTNEGTQPLQQEFLEKPRFRELAYEGLLVRLLVPNMSTRLAEVHRERLLALHNMGSSVMMEWQSAQFFLRRGLALNWVEPNSSGCEFMVDGGPISIEVECRRFKRLMMEKLSDRDATSIAWGTLEAIRDLQFTGVVTIDSPIESSNLPIEEAYVYKTVCDALRQFDQINLDLALPGIGQMSGWLHKLDKHFIWGNRGQLDEKVQGKPADHRSYGRSIEAAEGYVGGAAALYLKGPRLTPFEHEEHVLSALSAKAEKQFSGRVPGVIVAEHEGVRDVTAYQGMSKICSDLFRLHPHVAAVIWRSSISFALEDGGQMQPTCAYRNPNCSFQGAMDIPIFDREF